MQFILSKKELDALVPKVKLTDMTTAALGASKLLAETIDRNEHGWKGCILNKTTKYCNACPALNFCPYGYKLWAE